MTNWLSLATDICRPTKVVAPRKIVTNFVYPPIPLRQFDWTAWRDGEEENGPTGFGATEAEAIADLRQQIEDSRP